VPGLTGAAEYDDEVRARTVFAAEAGLSFFHTHAEGLGVVGALGLPWQRIDRAAR
jgi:hypothetical protein